MRHYSLARAFTNRVSSPTSDGGIAWSLLRDVDTARHVRVECSRQESRDERALRFQFGAHTFREAERRRRCVTAPARRRDTSPGCGSSWSLSLPARRKDRVRKQRAVAVHTCVIDHERHIRCRDGGESDLRRIGDVETQRNHALVRPGHRIATGRVHLVGTAPQQRIDEFASEAAAGTRDQSRHAAQAVWLCAGTVAHVPTPHPDPLAAFLQ